ncbi:hypothetical protein HS1genome_1176 [Sulfodiicoccus acidiphilus]|uniref:Uncharacterized protein n=1 Tax=Sulfodiicoccus acidiphilus TaxID=1670455 RepID=A0A348B3N5_9CREN|nr:hypothetical protein HS1genome_1176 [Sulfodiicoccus acidiphilus]GGT99809.1 hypothetical protein GCM10007116_16490 [Sulfodiicoccus acidiphilus]
MVRGNGLKTWLTVYRQMNGGWSKAIGYQAMKVEAANHKPVICPEGTIAPQGVVKRSVPH